MTHIQSVIGAIGPSSGSTSCSATGSAVGGGHLIVGMVMYYAYNTFSNVIDDKSNTYPDILTLTGPDSNSWVTVFGLAGVSGGPTTITANFSSNSEYIQVGWSEYSGVNEFVGYGGLSQNISVPSPGTDSINSGSFSLSANTGTLWGANTNIAGYSMSAGTGFTERANDLTAGDWGFIIEDESISGYSGYISFTPVSGLGLTGDYLTVGVGLSQSTVFLGFERKHLARKRPPGKATRKRRLPLPVIQPAKVIPYRFRPVRKLRPRSHRLRPRSLQIRSLTYPFPYVARPTTYNQGIAFRATGSFVTDVANFDFSAGGTYPQTTKQGNTVGFTVSYPTVVAQNERATQDARLAGNLYNNF